MVENLDTSWGWKTAGKTVAMMVEKMADYLVEMKAELKVWKMEQCLVASWGDKTARRLGDLKVDLTAAMMVGDLVGSWAEKMESRTVGEKACEMER